MSRSMPVMLLIVLIRLTASAPPSMAARAGPRMSATFGVSFTKTGTVAASLAHVVIWLQYSGTCPMALPMPRSDMPCGHPKLSSTPSAPASCACLTIVCHASRVDSTMRLTISAWSG